MNTLCQVSSAGERRGGDQGWAGSASPRSVSRSFDRQRSPENVTSTRPAAPGNTLLTPPPLFRSNGAALNRFQHVMRATGKVTERLQGREDGGCWRNRRVVRQPAGGREQTSVLHLLLLRLVGPCHGLHPAWRVEVCCAVAMRRSLRVVRRARILI